MHRTRVGILLIGFVALLLSAQTALGQWTLDPGGVWDIPNNRRIAWNPATGDIGNMGNAGVVFSIGPPPAGAQGGFFAGTLSAFAAFSAWNAYGTIPTVRIKLVLGNAGSKIPVRWAALAGTPGQALNGAINFNPEPIELHNTRVLRTDGWNLDFTGTVPDLIDEYDVYTTTVHEIGHTIGLDHPRSNTQVMTPQNTARKRVGGSWDVIEQRTPFNGEPTDLSGAALPLRARAYLGPRNLERFGLGDVAGAITLYSAPIASIAGVLTRIVVLDTEESGTGTDGCGGTYASTVFNASAHDAALAAYAGYRTRLVRLPVPPGVTVTNMVASTGWTITRESAAVKVEYGGSGGLMPGEAMNFSFDADAEPGEARPNVRWAIEGMTDYDDSDPEEGRGGSAPGFDPDDFTVLDGAYTYVFAEEQDAWVLIPFDPVVAPLTPCGGGSGRVDTHVLPASP